MSADRIAAGSLNADKITAGTITASKFNTFDIISNLIETNNITTHKLTVAGGSHLGALNVGSDGALTCGSNYSMSSAGHLTVNNASVHGNVTANTFATVNNTFTADSQGNINCNTGTFRNVKVVGSIYRPPVVITEQNWQTYGPDDESIDLSRTGLNVRIELTMSDVYVFFPHTADFIGAECTIVNFNQQQNDITIYWHDGGD